MNAEFNWWLLIVGLVVGAGLVWLILADSNRREVDETDEELPMEAAWISASLGESGRRLDPEDAELVLRLHRLYLAKAPPDEPDEAATDQVGGDDGEALETAEINRAGVAVREQPEDADEVSVSPAPPAPRPRRRRSVPRDDAGV